MSSSIESLIECTRVVNGRRALFHALGSSSAIVVALLVANPALAQNVTVQQPPYVNADGTRTNDAAAAAATWRADAEFKANWGQGAINADVAYAQGFSGAGVRLGVIDTGTLATHSEFSNPGKLISIKTEGVRLIDDVYNPFRAGDSFSLDGGKVWSDEGSVEDHGTHTGGTIAAQRDKNGMMGVAFGATLLAANGEGLGPARGTIDTFDSAVFATQVDQLVGAGARAINNSWGISPLTGSSPYSLRDVQGQYYGDTTHRNLDASERAARAGVVMVYSAGNEGTSQPNAIAGLPYFRQGAVTEQHYIVVANLQRNGRLSLSSNICGYTKYWCVSAPGSAIYSATASGNPENPTAGYGNKTGTSMAAPHVVGALGVVMERYSYLSSGQAADILKTTATDLGQQGVDEVFGWGRIDLAKAMNGPGQFLARFDANLPEGKSDIWSNDISQAALDQREGEDLAEIPAWADRKAALGLNNGIPDNLADTIAVTILPELAEGKRLLEAAIFANTPAGYTPAKLAAALVAAQANPGGAALLAAYEQARPGWTGPWSASTDYANFIATLGSDVSIATRFAVPEADAIKAEYAINESRAPGLAARSYDAGLTKSGLGTLVLAGANSYRGDTIVNGGELQIAPTGSIISASVVNDRSLLSVFGKAALVTVNSGGALNVEQAGITGDVTVNAAGRMTVRSNGVAGDVALNGGRASIDGISGKVSVNAGGLLGGTGTLASLAVRAGGVVAPGNSVGVLNVAGNASFDKGSGLNIQVSPTGAMDRLDVGGTATVAGGVVTMLPDNGTAPLTPAETLALLGKSNAILTAAGGVTGTFESVLPKYYFIGGTLTYAPNSVTLTLARNKVSFADAGNSRNEKAVGAGIEGLGLGNTLYNTVAVTQVGSDLASGYASLSGEVHASLGGQMVNDSRYVRDAILARMPNSRLSVDMLNRGTSDYVASDGLTGWAQVLTGFGQNDGTGNVAAVRSNAVGVVTGFDKSWADTVQLGVAVSYRKSDLTVKLPGSSGDANSYGVAGYVAVEQGPAKLRAGGSWERNNLNARHSATLIGLEGSSSAKYNGRTWQAFGELGLGFQMKSVAIEPYVGVTHVDFSSDDFQERGGPASLSGSTHQRLTSSTVGLRSAALLTGGANRKAAVTGHFDLAWQHNLSNSGALGEFAFAGGRSFTIAGSQAGRNVGTVDTGVTVKLNSRFGFNFTYGGRYGKHYQDHSVRAGLQWQF